MAIFNNWANLNINSYNLNLGWLNNIDSYNPFAFSWSMPSFPNYNFMSFCNFSSIDFSKIFSNNIWDSVNWNTGFNSNFNTNFNFNNNIFGNFNFTTSGDTFTKTSTDKNCSSLQLGLANKAKSYLGRVNSDKEGNRLFSNGNSRPWCADFVYYVTKKTFGNSLPSSFNNLTSVNALREWGEANNCYKKIPSSGKADYIAQNVKVGDIMIEKNGGKSHTGIVTKVNSDGSFETVEGNCSNKVATQHYKADSSTLSGFISLDKYAA